MQIKLSGLAEALTGIPRVNAKSKAAVFQQYPILKKYKNKLDSEKNLITGYVACDG
jgi:hypothetical protein